MENAFKYQVMRVTLNQHLRLKNIFQQFWNCVFSNWK